MPTVIMERAHPIVVTEGWVSDKSCLVTMGPRAYVTVVRRDITTGWPKREPNQHNTLQMVSEEALPILKEVFLTLTLRQCPVKIWVFVVNITNEFI